MRLLLLTLTLAAIAQSQDSTPVTPQNIPTVAMPAGFVATVNFNQLGTPRFTGGFAGFYPIVGSVGVYGLSGVEFYPNLATYPATGKQFYALEATVAQEVHKSIFTSGNFAMLIGMGGGPSLSSSAQAAGITVDLSANGSTTFVYQFTPQVSAVFSVKGLYISGAGWNLIPRLGVKVDLIKRAK